MSERIEQLFSAIASRYDLVNNLLCLGIHHYWNWRLVGALAPQGRQDYLDVCAGTGAITRSYLRRYKPEGRVVLLDFCEAMLAQAQKKLKGRCVEWVHADACHMPFESSSFDAISIAYGLRNIADPQQALRECRRVLRPSSRLALLELTRPNWPPLAQLHRFWLRYLVRPVGASLSHHGDAYSYLDQSILSFATPQTVCQWLSSSGFEKIRCWPLTGQAACLFTARTPA